METVVVVVVVVVAVVVVVSVVVGCCYTVYDGHCHYDFLMRRKEETRQCHQYIITTTTNPVLPSRQGPAAADPRRWVKRFLLLFITAVTKEENRFASYGGYQRNKRYDDPPPS